MRRRLRAACEHFVDIRDLTHEAAARRIREDGIDILVDLKGYTRNARLEILAQRPSPIQITWLGFPGGLGSDFIDFLIADPVVIPPDQADCYDESIVYLPDAYAPVDDRRQVAARPTRAEAGLPEDAFVFACFNDPYKITPEVFERWCRLLQSVPGSVLWLYARTEAIRRNLTREAESRGIAAERLIFAPKRPQPEHLARLPLADLCSTRCRSMPTPRPRTRSGWACRS
jgi:protein O-GlcNAc transferase